MPAGQDCCNSCPEVQVTNIPGSVGATGAAGADGINAFTFTAAPGFIVPALGANVTVPTVESSWMTPGQNVYVQGAGTFVVVSVAADGTSAVLTYLPGYDGNTHTSDVIPAGYQISPSGVLLTVLPEQTFYANGDNEPFQAVTNVNIMTSVVTLPTAGKWLIQAGVRIDLDGVTIVTPITVFLKLREVVNTGSDIANAVREVLAGVKTNATETLSIAIMPTVVYTAAANDAVRIYGSVSELPYAGNIIAVEAFIMALPIN